MSNGSCCICLESLLAHGIQSLACGHLLHESCAREMRRLGSSGRCPICRRKDDEPTVSSVACCVNTDNALCNDGSRGSGDRVELGGGGEFHTSHEQ